MAKKDFVKKTASEIQKMWEAYQENPSTNYVAKKVGVSWQSAKKYIERENMAARMKKINGKALAIADNAVAKHRAKAVKIAETVIALFAQSLIGHVNVTCSSCGEEVRVPIPTSKIDSGDFLGMVQLIERMTGTDEAPEQKIIIEYVDKPIERNET